MARVNQQEPFYSPNAKPALPRQPKPGERIWTLLKAGKHALEEAAAQRQPCQVVRHCTDS